MTLAFVQLAPFVYLEARQILESESHFLNYDFIDKTGKFAIEAKYGSVDDFQQGLAKTCTPQLESKLTDMHTLRAVQFFLSAYSQLYFARQKPSVATLAEVIKRINLTKFILAHLPAYALFMGFLSIVTTPRRGNAFANPEFMTAISTTNVNTFFDIYLMAFCNFTVFLGACIWIIELIVKRRIILINSITAFTSAGLANTKSICVMKNATRIVFTFWQRYVMIATNHVMQP